MDLTRFTILLGARRGSAEDRHAPARTGSLLLPDLLLVLVGQLNRDHRDGATTAQLERAASRLGVVTHYWRAQAEATYWLAWTPSWTGYAAALAFTPDNGWWIDLRPSA